MLFQNFEVSHRASVALTRFRRKVLYIGIGRHQNRPCARLDWSYKVVLIYTRLERAYSHPQRTLTLER